MAERGACAGGRERVWSGNQKRSQGVAWAGRRTFQPPAWTVQTEGGGWGNETSQVTCKSSSGEWWGQRSLKECGKQVKMGGKSPAQMGRAGRLAWGLEWEAEMRLSKDGGGRGFRQRRCLWRPVLSLSHLTGPSVSHSQTPSRSRPIS